MCFRNLPTWSRSKINWQLSPTIKDLVCNFKIPCSKTKKGNDKCIKQCRRVLP